MYEKNTYRRNSQTGEREIETLPSVVDNSEALFRRRSEEPAPEVPTGLKEVFKGDIAETAARKPVAPVERKQYELGPWADRVLVLPLDPDPYWSSEADIIKPDDFKEKQHIGRIVAHGPGRTLASGEIVPFRGQLDQVVVYGKYAGAEIELNGIKYLVLREEEIIGVVKEKP